jgi:serine/threonine protein kinase
VTKTGLHQLHNCTTALLCRANLSLSDFEIERRIGDGSYATVLAVRLRSTGAHYALKIVDKALVLRHKMAAYVRSERLILDRMEYDGIARLFFTFQDAISVCAPPQPWSVALILVLTITSRSR